MALSFPNKDPQEVLDYVLDWSKRLGGDVILTSTWAVDDAGLVIDSKPATFTPTDTTIWLSAGVLNTSYLLTNHIVTQGDRTMEQSVKIKIKQK
jgi:hypothetical protein